MHCKTSALPPTSATSPSPAPAFDVRALPGEWVWREQTQSPRSVTGGSLGEKDGRGVFSCNTRHAMNAAVEVVMMATTYTLASLMAMTERA